MNLRPADGTVISIVPSIFEIAFISSKERSKKKEKKGKEG
jgi:hypothetical protein